MRGEEREGEEERLVFGEPTLVILQFLPWTVQYFITLHALC